MKFWSAIFTILFFSSQVFANAIGVGVQNFHPTYSGLDFVTVHSSNTLKPGIVNVGAFLNYSKNTLPYFSNGHEDDQTWAAQLHIGLGLTRNWDIGYAMPMILDQEVDSAAAIGSFETDGVTEHRIQTKYRFLEGETWGAALIGGVTLDNTTNYPLSGEDAGPTWTIELAVDKQLNEKVRLAFNTGYRKRDPGATIAQFTTVSPIKDQWLVSAAANYALTEYKSVLITEIYTSLPAQSSDRNSDKEITSAEWLLGYKYVGIKNLDLHAGAGTEILQGTSTPDWRVYAGFNWQFGPLWGTKEEAPKSQTFVATEEVEETIDITEYEEYKEIPVKQKANYVVRNINFEFNSDKLDAKSKETLNKFANFLKTPPGIKSLTVNGHTDSLGSDKYNLNLSQKRANAVKNYLATQGIAATKIKAVGYGESRPVDTNETDEGRIKNRRVEFKVER